jgi:trehalose 6-phosphate synthase
MNLVAKEYVAARFDLDGVLVLSEFTGSADELRAALLINPHDIDGLKDAIMRAVEMPGHERRKRMKSMRKRVREHSVGNWSEEFLAALRAASSGSQTDDTLGELEWTIERPMRRRRS